MQPDVFRRFLLVVACTAYVLALGAVWLWLAWALAVAAGVIGPLIALLLSVESVEKPAHPTAPEVEGLSRRDIARRSHAA